MLPSKVIGKSYSRSTATAVLNEYGNLKVNSNPQSVLLNPAQDLEKMPEVKIVEQPASKALRFRYVCEGNSAGSIPGVHSTTQNKTFPTIEIINYYGPAVVVVSCVTKDRPYRPHPHNLVGKDGCKKGVCTIEIKRKTMRAVFRHLGIQCVKKNDIESALTVREEIRVDPFKTGFSHKKSPSSIDLNSVRLCFQVFLDTENKGHFTLPLTPVVSDPIYDKKNINDLVITRLCSCSSTVDGGKEIILLCEKVVKEDISVRFFEELDGQVIWEAYGDFHPSDVHKKTAITFKTPKYRTLQIDQPVTVNIQLRRPSDGETSEGVPFEYIPLNSDTERLKRRKIFLNGDAHIRLEDNHQQKNVPSTLDIGSNRITEPRKISANPFFGNIPEQDELPFFQRVTPQYNGNDNIASSYDKNQQHQSSAQHQPFNNQYLGNTNPNMIEVPGTSYQPVEEFQHQQQSNLTNHIDPVQSSRTTLGAQITVNSNTFDVNMSNNNESMQKLNQFNQHWQLIGKNNLDSRQSQNNFDKYKLNNLNFQYYQIKNKNNINISNNNYGNNMNQNNSLSNLLVNFSNAGESSLLDMDTDQLMQLNSAELSILSIN